MSSTNEQIDQETGEIYETVVEQDYLRTGYSKEGVEQLTFISGKALKPTPGWIYENIVKDKPAGFRKDLAQLTGWCNHVEVVMSQLPGEKDPSPSLRMKGNFRLRPLVDGIQAAESRFAFLPKIWAERVQEAVGHLDLEADPAARVTMILTLGAQSTGKPDGIAHRWTVRNHLPESDPTLDMLERIAAGPAPKRIVAAKPSPILDAEAAD
jgi:hypothetical protein